ncbi:hypothetical protein DUI87_12376 [Hirundo rustica rustica]|uniref:RNA 2-O ribose methyltransferase substrate binding domain-containing protein n=1 Tax=Hirundo rustica rustica TaxID=333673 RepID=A0A3M0KC56_HIRRU|nr:hypothetical protein DUI87_12376 [Hirundo rustica rustica]
MAALGRAWRALLRPGGARREPGGRRGVRALRRSPVRVLQPRGPAESPAERPESPAERSAAAPGLWYEKAAPGDRRLGKVVTLAKSKKFRDNHGKVLLEGHRLIKDALEAGAVPQTLFFSTVGHLKLLPEAEIKRASLVKVKFEDIKTWSDLVTPQGLLGIFSKPDPAKMSYPAAQLASSLPLLLICDNIRDPGNLGTILRSAAGAGCEKVLLTKGCVDPWEPKVCVADNNDPDAPAGITSVPRAAGRAGSAPASPKTPVKPSPKAAPEHEDEEGAAGIPELAAQRYYEDWARAPVAVVIGGETHGLSPAALRLAASTGGKRLLIPVVPGVDSLNSAIAAGIVLFEGRRQLLCRHKQEDGRQKLPVPG